jgi:hypothetical protein
MAVGSEQVLSFETAHSSFDGLIAGGKYDCIGSFEKS